MDSRPWFHTLAILFFSTVFCLTVYHLPWPFAGLLGVFSLAALLRSSDCQGRPHEPQSDWY